MRQAYYRELAKISHKTPKTCFCIYEDSDKAFGEWRERESVINEDDYPTRSAGDHIKCDLFLCEVARQEKPVTVSKVTRKNDGGAAHRRVGREEKGRRRKQGIFLSP